MQNGMGSSIVAVGAYYFLALVVSIPTYLVALPVLCALRLLKFLIIDSPINVLAQRCGASQQRARRWAMRAEDSFMLMETETTRCNIIAVLELSSPTLDLKSLRILIEDSLLSSRPSSTEDPCVPMLQRRLVQKQRWPRLKQHPVQFCGCWFWEDMGNTFNLAAHVREANEVVDEDSLFSLLAQLQSEKMPMNRPLWDIHLATPNSGNGGSTVIFRVHHAVADGIALVRVLLDAIDGGSSPSAEPVKVGHRGRNTLVALASALFFAPLLAVRQLLQPKDTGIFKPSTLTGRKVAALSAPIEVTRIKSLANLHDSTFSAVIVACFSRALASYSDQACDNVSERRTRRNALKFWVPVSFSPKETKMENRLCFLMVPMDMNSSAEGALDSATDSLRNVKSTNEAFALVLVLRATILLLPSVIAQSLLNWIGDKATGVFSSLPGPSAELSWGGRCISSIGFLVPQRSGFAIGLSALSYAGKLRISVSGDMAAVSKPQLIVDGFHAALAELENS